MDITLVGAGNLREKKRGQLSTSGKLHMAHITINVTANALQKNFLPKGVSAVSTIVKEVVAIGTTIETLEKSLEKHRYNRYNLGKQSME